MVSSRAWFALVCVAVVGLFYVGSGSRERWVLQLPKGNAAMAQEVPKTKLSWQPVPSDCGGIIFRSRVPGGWLIQLTSQSSQGHETGITFMPDAEHVWDGGSVK